jgi:hypothetical protein
MADVDGVKTRWRRIGIGSSDLVVETDSSNICSVGAPNPCTNLGACKKSLLSSVFQRYS